MLSEALQRNAKHEARLSNISDLCIVSSTKFQRLKAWPRGLRPLRCSFASLRMTLSDVSNFRTDPPMRPRKLKAGRAAVESGLAIDPRL